MAPSASSAAAAAVLLLAAVTATSEGGAGDVSAFGAGGQGEGSVAALSDLNIDDAFDDDDDCGGDEDDEQCSVNLAQLRAHRARAAAAAASADADAEGGAEGGAESAVGANLGGFESSKETRSFAWTAPTRSIEDALSAPGWEDATFSEGAQAGKITISRLASWIRDDLFAGAGPFGSSGSSVPVPWPARDGDQVGPGQWVAYTRRQVCYIAAKALVGSGTKGYNNGLTRFMSGCPKQGDFGRSMVALLSSCAADPSLASGAQGPLVLVARGEKPPSVEEAKKLAETTKLSTAGLRICQYDDEATPLEGVETVPEEGCRAPSSSGVGRDFMTGGLKRQAVQDISASFLGGYVFGNACGLGGGQDERLMVYFPEVATLTFFLSQDRQFPQLRQPAWVLGARMFFTGLDGTGRFNAPLVLDHDLPLTSDLREVTLDSGRISGQISTSRPFIAFMSENQGFFGHEDYNKLQLARRNKHELQRAVKGKFAFDKQVRAWYGAVRLSSYHPAVQHVLTELVGSIGSGPWLAGLWWGDSQVGFLASWIGQALAATTWASDVLPLDYYIYSDFTENPGNQCFVHSRANCKACMAKCSSHTLPNSAFWMPNYALVHGSSCAEGPSDCGEAGVEQVFKAFSGDSAGQLWDKAEAAMRGSGTSGTVFDALLA